MTPALQEAKEKFRVLVDQQGIGSEAVQVTIGTLSPDQAIGKPKRQDFALLGGKEVMIEALFKEKFGQAFTNQPQSFDGLLNEVMNLDLNSTNNRAIFVATLNAVCSHLGFSGKFRHCRNHEPEECGKQLAKQLLSRYGEIRIGMIGYQPAILENMARTFDPDNVRCSDLDSRNIGANRFGVTICDGGTENNDLIDWCDLLLATGSTHVNGTFDNLYQKATAGKKKLITFGVTATGISGLLGLETICPLGH